MSLISQTEKGLELETEPPAVTIDEAAAMVEGLRRFGLENNKPEIIEAMLQIEGTIQELKFEHVKKSKQSLLTTFFPLSK